jgi:hypothetical protein
MPVARSDLDLLMHFAHRAAIDTYLSDTSSEETMEAAAQPIPSVSPTTCRICGFQTRNERYMAMHSRRRDHQTILLLPLKKRKWLYL